MNDTIDVSTMTFEEMLARIDVFLSSGNSEAQKLWAVMTAMRGPDDETLDSLKLRTTNRLRTRAFPKAANSIIGNVAQFAEQSELQYGIVLHEDEREPHFLHHIYMAASALGMTYKVGDKVTVPWRFDFDLTGLQGHDIPNTGRP